MKVIKTAVDIYRPVSDLIMQMARLDVKTEDGRSEFYRLMEKLKEAAKKAYSEFVELDKQYAEERRKYNELTRRLNILIKEADDGR